MGRRVDARWPPLRPFRLGRRVRVRRDASWTKVAAPPQRQPTPSAQASAEIGAEGASGGFFAALPSRAVTPNCAAGTWGSAPVRVSTGPMTPRFFTFVLPRSRVLGGPRFERMAARIKHALAGLRAARWEVDASMAREPFGAAALRGAMTASSGRWTAFGAAFADTMFHAMAAVSPQGRAQVAAARRRDG
jgi:hypothetical protein